MKTKFFSNFTLTLVFTLFLFTNICEAQITIEPSIGHVFFKNTGFQNHLSSVIITSPYENFRFSNWNFGLGIWKKVSEKLDVGFITNYNQNSLGILIFDTSMVPITGGGIEKNYKIRFSGLMKYCLPTGIEIGVGPSFCYLSKPEIGPSFSSESISFDEFQYGLKSLLSYNVSSANFSLTYSFLRFLGTNSERYLESTQVIALSVGYSFRLNKKT
jgi:hypothetical protein